MRNRGGLVKAIEVVALIKEIGGRIRNRGCIEVVVEIVVVEVDGGGSRGVQEKKYYG